MTPKEVNTVISFHINRIKRWDSVWLNGERIYAEDLRKVAKEGDHVRWEAYRSRWSDSRHFYVTRQALEDALEFEAHRKEWKAKSSRLRDSQRSRVYAWEREVVRRGYCPKVADPKALVDEVFEAYGLAALSPRVIVSRRKDRYSTYHGGFQHKIVLAAAWGTDMEVVLHEAAHALLAVGYGAYEGSTFKAVPIEPHGPEFVALLMELYEMYLPEGLYDPKRATVRVRIAWGFCLATHVKTQRAVSPLYVQRAEQGIR